MAEEEKTKENNGEKKSKTILFVVIGIIVVLLLLVGILLVVMLTGGHDKEETQEVAQPQVQSSTATQQAAQIIVGNTVSVRNTDKHSPGLIYPAEAPLDFKVNLMTQTGKRFLKASVQFELDKDEKKAKAKQAELEKKLPILKDTIIEILSSKSIEDVATTKGKNRVKDEIVKRVNELLLDGGVYDVFFVDFVVS